MQFFIIYRHAIVIRWCTCGLVPPPLPSDNSIIESPSASSVGPTLVSSSSSTSSTDTCLDNTVDGVGVDVAEAQDLCTAFFWDWEVEGWVDLSACFGLVSITFLDLAAIIVEG